MTNLPEFKPTPYISSGDNCYSILRHIDCTNALIVVSKSMAVGSVLSFVEGHLRSHIKSTYVPNWSGEPKLEDLKPLINKIEEEKPDLIITVGGGGIIDAVKAARAIIEFPWLISNFSFDDKYIFNINNLYKSKTVAIPTTIGAGAEVSEASVLKNSSGVKKFIISQSFISDYVILDPNLLLSLPYEVKLSTMCDAASHAIESFVSKISNPFAEEYCIIALRLISDYWRRCLDDNTELEVLRKLQFAALYAGMVQNRMLVGASHALSHVHSKFNLSHGVANGIFLPSSIIINSEEKWVKELYEKLAYAAGFNNGISGLLDMTNEMKSLLPEYEFSVLSDLDYNTAVKDPGGRANPIDLSKELLEKIERHANER